MMMNAGDQGFRYTADRELWESIPDFEPQAPRLPEVLGAYALELAFLGLWLLVAGFAALRATRRAITQGG
jgi:hypothetical protein